MRLRQRRMIACRVPVQPAEVVRDRAGGEDEHALVAQGGERLDRRDIHDDAAMLATRGDEGLAVLLREDAVVEGDDDALVGLGADEAADAFLAFRQSRAAVDLHLADQIVLYLARAPGPSSLITPEITQHLLTNLWVIEQFLGPTFQVAGKRGERFIATAWRVPFDEDRALGNLLAFQHRDKALSREGSGGGWLAHQVKQGRLIRGW